MADLFGYNPKSEDLEASMLFIYTTDLYNKNRFPYQESGISSFLSMKNMWKINILVPETAGIYN